MLQVDILTLFPDFFNSPLATSFFRRASDQQAWRVGVHDIRELAPPGIHRQADDAPYGGGPGMVMQLDPVAKSLEKLGCRAFPKRRTPDRKIILLSASGQPFRQAQAEAFARCRQLVLICGHYEGVDERLLDLFPIEEVSIGDYVLTGGESAALVVLDAVVRLLPEVLGNPESLREESFQDGLLDYPVYSRPADYRGLAVPEVLLSGHHGQIAQWRREQALLKTARQRPDLFATLQVTAREAEWLRDQGIAVAESAILPTPRKSRRARS